MFSPLCFLRAIGHSIRAGCVVHGHHYRLLDPEPDQACCVRVFECEVCKHVHIGWESCTCKGKQS